MIFAYLIFDFLLYFIFVNFPMNIMNFLHHIFIFFLLRDNSHFIRYIKIINMFFY
jgi:hypothetical protein